MLKNCTEVAKNMLKEAKKEWKLNYSDQHYFVIISASDDMASSFYIRNKILDAEECGIPCRIEKLEAERDSSGRFEVGKITNRIYNKIKLYNDDELCVGIMIQLPLYGFLEKYQSLLVNTIEKEKDIDGLTQYNQGMIVLSETPLFYPCTAIGIIRLLDENEFEYEGKVATVIGRSLLIGKPITHILAKKNMTTISCNSKTKREDLIELCRKSDLIISATGVLDLITEEFVREGTIVIDVGINRDSVGKLQGDVCRKLKENEKYKDYITPVPAGVGLLTRASLMLNVAKKK